MSSKKVYLYTWIAEKDGVEIRFRIYKQGGNYFIDDCLVHASNRSEAGVKAEIALVFGAKPLRKLKE